MKYIRMELNADTVGTQEVHYIEVADDLDENTIEDMYRGMIMDHAQGYGYEYLDWAEENIEDYDADEDENCEYWDEYEAAVMEFGNWEYLPDKPTEDQLDETINGLEYWAML